MVYSAAPDVLDYLAHLPAERQAAIATVRDVINARLPPGYEERMLYGMISWVVPAAHQPETYNGQPLTLAALASQKQAMSLYLMTVYGDPAIAAAFTAAAKAAGKRLDMGKSCVRFSRVDQLPLDAVGDVIGRVSLDTYVARYREAHAGRRLKPVVEPAPSGVRTATAQAPDGAGTSTTSGAKKPAAKKPAAKKPAAKKPAAKKPAAKQAK